MILQKFMKITQSLNFSVFPTNPSFEGNINGWDLVSGNASSISNSIDGSPVPADMGSYCLLLKTLNGNPKVSQSISITPGEYVLHYYVFPNGNTCTVEVTNGGHVLGSDTFSGFSNGLWNQRRIAFTVPSSVSNVTIEITATNPGDYAYFDMFAIAEN